jgi:hypothetical protein
MTFDRIDWHMEAITEDLSKDELLERAGAHIGYFIEWAYKKELAPDNPETNDINKCQKVINSEVNGIRFLIDNCDTKFWDVDLNTQGQSFAIFAYNKYIENLESILGHKPYINKYNQQDFLNVSKYLDEVYSDYLLNSPTNHVETESKKISFFQKFKNLFS